MARRYLGAIAALIVAIVIFSFRGIATFATDLLWFRELGYPQAFWIPIASRIVVGLAVGAAFFGFLLANVRLTTRGGRACVRLRSWFAASPWLTERRLRALQALVCLTVGIFAGVGASSSWMVAQKFLHPAHVGRPDPLFGLDAGFYMFTLPFYRYAYSVAMTLAVLTTLAVVGVYVLNGSLGLRGVRVAGSAGARRHAALLVALVFFLKAWGYRLSAFALVYSRRGVVFGAGYADVHALLPGLRVLSLLALLAGALVLASVFARAEKLALGAVAALVAGSIVLGSAYPSLVQKLSVEPNELSRERTYIAYNIAATRAAFGLDAMQARPFDVRNDLTFDRLMTAHADTVDNIRLWDWRPLSQTYGQLQEIRVYYSFFDVDLDRYGVAGKTTQMALAARELSMDQLPEQARTWVNEHLVYTHGYGLAMNDVSEVSNEGLPRFVIGDIPPKADPGFEVVRPEIYYGELTDSYVVVRTSAQEFDYPTPQGTAYTRYAGRGGVALSSFWRKLAFAARFGSLKFLMSSDMTSESRVLFARNVRERVRRIAPFLEYDRDPYLVLADGRLFWIWDAYTVSDLYPYSQPSAEGVNYIRNPVKVVVDAYEGDVRFYLRDPSEPIANSLGRVFPGLFRPFEAMPESLKAHVRYPEDLFTIQAAMLNTYHMTDPGVLYNREDAWEFPEEVYAGQRQRVQPYYVLMRPPGEDAAQYLLIVPFTPSGKQNMIGWLAAKNDPPHYGELVLYTFPKDRVVYGPIQVESRIDQDPAISQALTLWSQSGSRVLRGNLLVIPIENSIIYVEPLYLLAERSELPELKRVIAAYRDNVAMDTTLQGALAAVFGAQPKAAGILAAPGQPGAVPRPAEPPRAVEDTVRRAVQAFEAANARLREGDFAGFGESLAELGALLRQLQEGAR